MSLRRLDDLKRISTKEVYDKFARFDPKPTFTQPPGGNSSLDKLPEEGPVYTPGILNERGAEEKKPRRLITRLGQISPRKKPRNQPIKGNRPAAKNRPMLNLRPEGISRLNRGCGKRLVQSSGACLHARRNLPWRSRVRASTHPTSKSRFLAPQVLFWNSVPRQKIFAAFRRRSRGNGCMSQHSAPLHRP